MQYQVLGPIEGRDFRFLTTHVRAAGRGVPSDASRLERELEVALANFDITIDLSEVEELGAEGIEAIAGASNKVRGWNSGRLFLLADPEHPVWGELESSELATPGWHPRVFISEARSGQTRESQ
jgi:hypothetical protein